ncbi:sulfurtransferase complex subunit TusD [Candidatus Methylocalor cossyra]|uniref:Sulfurtransferase DsrE n=1 Tax=Candidatus Methylocalor cossyra TaxID=3108543 RepID=A0ABM9NLB5_9GAMM
MDFAIQVNDGPGASCAAHAYQFIKAAVEEGHRVVRVFFYHEGIYHGFVAADREAGEDLAIPTWSELAQRHGIDLVICGSAAARRGMRPPHCVPNPGFRVGGLGQWMEACLGAERVLVFGG